MWKRPGELFDGGVDEGDEVSDAHEGIAVLDGEVCFRFCSCEEFLGRVAKVKQEAIADRVQRKSIVIHRTRDGLRIVAQCTRGENLG